MKSYIINHKVVSEEDLDKRTKQMAFHLQYDNLFDMAKIFTEADLKAVKENNSFFEKLQPVFNEKSQIIESKIAELKTTQPLLPVTKFPSASTIKSAVKTINEDGSTDIKGVYIDKNGLVVLKFNEVENWKKIGFPKGTVSKGISAEGINNNGQKTKVDTGNLKFFAHGLDFENQLYKFEAFNLPDSDALLSVSYAERPESKYRFFRTQGVILDIDTQNLYGGGNTDSGSGYAKDIDEFIFNYAFDGSNRYSDRTYVSDLIKEATGMSDSEYTEFIAQNRNKPMQKIEPKEYREPIIKTLATINSNVRRGNREYNEMYGSNPNVMGVFAYSGQNTPIKNPINLVNNKNEKFLIDYALEKDIPYVVFGG